MSSLSLTIQLKISKFMEIIHATFIQQIKMKWRVLE